MTKDNYIRTYTTGIYDDFNIQVVKFIAEILYDNRNKNGEICSFFRSGYCYHFANILLSVFNRGKICIAEPFGHIVWVDVDSCPYDIEGPYIPDLNGCERLTDIKFLGDTIYDFIHIPGKEYHAPKDFHNWADLMNMSDVFAMTKIYIDMPKDIVDYNSTLEQNVYYYWIDHKHELEEKYSEYKDKGYQKNINSDKY